MSRQQSITKYYGPINNQGSNTSNSNFDSVKASALSPCAGCTALPFETTLGDSAALGLAAGRQSRIPMRATSECAVGALFVSLSGRIARRLPGGRLQAASIGRPYPDSVASAVVIDG